MRWLVLVAVLPLLAGCLDNGNGLLSGSGGGCDFVPQQAVLIDTYDVLLPAVVPVGPHPRVAVEVPEGGTLVASATWSATGGQAHVVFDGPGDLQVATSRTFAATTFDVPAGNYSLYLEGDPSAFEGTYVLSLTATC